MSETPFSGGRMVLIMDLETAERVTRNGEELTDRNPVAGRIPGSPLPNRDHCVAAVVFDPRMPEGEDHTIVAVVDTKVGSLVWVNPANANGVTPCYLSAIASITAAEGLQAEGS